MQIIHATRINRREMKDIEEAVCYIDRHFHEKITPEDLSQRFLIPPKKLQAGFQRRTGYTVHNYLMNVRLLHSKLLLSGDEPIKIIAAKIGYSNQSHFGQFFKKLAGTTPAEYRLSLEQ